MDGKVDTNKNLFKKYKDKITAITEHYDGCQYIDRNIPIYVCMCDCYQRRIFELGRKAERDLFYR